MALTFTEAAKLSQNQMHLGVIQTLYTKSDILKVLPWTVIEGNALQIAREAATDGSDPDWFDVNEDLPAGTSTFAAATYALKRLGGVVKTPNFSQLTQSNFIDQRATQLALKLKKMAQAFDQAFIAGNSTTNAKQPDGLRAICTTGIGNRFTAGGGANGATLTIAMIDELLDKVDGDVSALIMTRRTRRKLKALLEAGGNLMDTHETFGKKVKTYDGIPILLTEFIGDALTRGTSTDCSEIYAVNFDPGWGVNGIQSNNAKSETVSVGSDKVTIPGPWIKEVGESESSDSWVDKLIWYPSIATYSLKALCCMDGVRP